MFWRCVLCSTSAIHKYHHNFRAPLASFDPSPHETVVHAWYAFMHVFLHTAVPVLLFVVTGRRASGERGHLRRRLGWRLSTPHRGRPAPERPPCPGFPTCRNPSRCSASKRAATTRLRRWCGQTVPCSARYSIYVMRDVALGSMIEPANVAVFFFA